MMIVTVRMRKTVNKLKKIIMVNENNIILKNLNIGYV